MDIIRESGNYCVFTNQILYIYNLLHMYEIENSFNT